MSQEIELRLSAHADDLAKLARSPFLKQFSPGRSTTRRLVTVYYDTPDLVLARAGFSLRVRRQGRGIVQTVKGADSGGLASDRLECEAPLPTANPDLRFVADPDLRARLLEWTAESALVPTVETNISRTIRLLTTEAGDTVELAVDRGDIRTLGDVQIVLPVAEIELELKSGNPAALYEIARGFVDRNGVGVTTESKSARGLRALQGHPPCASKAGRTALDRDATVEDAFRATLLHCLRHIVQNAPVVSDARDVEGLHQLRVGLRRLRAALTAFEIRTPAVETLRTRAKALADAFGATRELDVFAENLLAPVEAFDAHRPGVAALRLALEALRRASWDRAVLQVRDKGFTEFLLDLASCAETRCWRTHAGAEQLEHFARPAAEHACHALGARQRKTRKRAKHLSRLEPHARHRLRIALKKLRYSAEFFAPLFAEKQLTAYLRQLSKAQDVFGALNDASMTENILQRIFAHAGPEVGAEMRDAASFVAGWHAGQIETAWKKARRRWKTLEKTEPFWRI